MGAERGRQGGMEGSVMGGGREERMTGWGREGDGEAEWRDH